MVTFLILLLFAVIFLVAGVALLYFRSRNKQKATLMGQTETSSASDVSGLAPGTLVEVKGTLRCEEPLLSEMAKTSCAYYLSTVTREYLESDYGDDDDVGSDRRSETLSQNEQVAPFAVEDATGSVAVAAEGAEVDAKQVVNRFERDASGLSIAGIPVRDGLTFDQFGPTLEQEVVEVREGLGEREAPLADGDRPAESAPRGGVGR